MTSATEASRAVVEKMNAAGSAGDFAGMMAMFASDLVVHEPPFLPWGGEHHGHDGFVALFGRLNENLDMTRVKAERLLADGPWVINVLRIPDRRTGKDVLVIDEMLIRDGVIAEMRVYLHDAQSLVPQQ
jgi:ketosteroid isomerase-like protein